MGLFGPNIEKMERSYDVLGLLKLKYSADSKKNSERATLSLDNLKSTCFRQASILF
jgi:hypothetical protein